MTVPRCLARRALLALFCVGRVSGLAPQGGLGVKSRAAGCPSTTRRGAATVAEAAAVDVEEAIYLSSAERARTTAELGIGSGAVLSTLCAEGSETAGAPFTTHVDYVLDKEGSPVLLLDTLRAEHSKNLFAANRCSVLLSARSAGAAPASSPRVTVVGSVEAVPADAEDRVVLEALFGVNHAYADDVLNGGVEGFDLYRLLPETVYFVGGFGVAATWVAVDDYVDAAADAVAKEARDLCGVLNDNRRQSDRAIAAAQLLDVDDAETCRVMAVDRLGVDFRVKRKSGITEEYRVAYRASARSVEDAKSEIEKLLQEAWELDQGLQWDGAYASKPVVVKRATDAK